jgi:hypothetical protein
VPGVRKRQKPEIRSQKSEVRRRNYSVGAHRRAPSFDVGSQKAEARSQRPEVRDWRSEVGQKVRAILDGQFGVLDFELWTLNFGLLPGAIIPDKKDTL